MKRKIIFALALVMIIVSCLAACNAEKIVTGLTVVEGTLPTNVEVGSTPDFSGVKAEVQFSNGTTETVGADALTIGKLDTSSEGTKKLLVTYDGYTISVDVTVVKTPVVLESINIVASSVPTTVETGADYDISKLQIEATYSDGSVKMITGSELTVTLPDTATPGDKKLTVSFGGKTAELSVKVIGVNGITLIANTLKTEIYVGESLDLTRVQAQVSYTNGKTEIVEASALTFGAVDTASMGTKKLAVTYKGFTAEVDITVSGVTSIVVNPGSVATSVRVFGTLNTSGISAKAVYSNGDELPLTAAQLTVGTIDTATAGVKQLTVSYAGVSTQVEITVVGVKSIVVLDGLKSEILVGEALDTSALRVTVTYTDDTAEIKSASELSVGQIDTATAGDKTLAITYLDGEGAATVKVCGPVGIEVEGVPLYVVAGETPDLSAMKVYLVYGDTARTRVLLTEGYTDNRSTLNFNEEGAKTLTVTYGDFTDSAVIDTTAPELVSIEILTYTAKVGLGQAYSVANVTAKATYGNGATAIVPAENLVINGITTDEAGDKTLTVSYTDAETNTTASASVTVKVLPITALAVHGLATKVDIGATFDITGLEVTVTYGNDEITETVTVADGVTVSTLNTQTSGDKTVTVSYLGASVTHALHVKGLSSIKILDGSIDKVVRASYAPDLSRLVLELTFTNGDVEQKRASELGSAVTSSSAVASVTVDGKVYPVLNLTVNYSGLSAQAQLKVLGVHDMNGLNGTVPTPVMVGTALDTSTMKLTVIYKDYYTAFNEKGDPYEVIVGLYTYVIDQTDERLTIVNADTSSYGERAVQFVFTLPDGSTQTVIVRVLVLDVARLEIIGGLETTVPVGAELDLSEVQLKVTYTDGSYTYADTASGVTFGGTVDTSAKGNKTLSIFYNEKHKLDVTISVVEKTAENGILFGVALPSSLTAREAYKTGFKVQDEIYVVGDDNPFIFRLVRLMLDDKGNLVDTSAGYVSSSKVYLLANENDSAGTLVGSEYVAINENNNSFDFTDAAIGKIFKIVSGPEGTSFTKSFVVKVVDAYNVYDAKELNLITNRTEDIGGELFEPKNQLQAVTDFLNLNGISMNDANGKRYALSGVVLHKNFDIGMEHLPPEYFGTYTKDGVTKVALYDWSYIYNRVFNAPGETFTLYGNYYSIYSYNIPCVAEAGYLNNPDEFSSSSLIRFKTDIPLYDSDAEARAFDPSLYRGMVVNTNFRDNDPNSNDQSASERHMRGIVCIKLTRGTYDVYNTNVEAYFVSVVPEYAYTTANIIKSKLYNAWQGHIFVWNNNSVQNYGGGKDLAPYDNYQGVHINISDSLLAKCGGPVILNQNADRDFKCNEKAYTDIRVDSASDLHTYVTGQEAWFVAVGQTQMAGMILAMNRNISMFRGAPVAGVNAGFTSKDFIPGISTVNMVMVNMGEGMVLGETGYKYYGTMITDVEFEKDANGNLVYDESGRVKYTGGVMGLNMTNNPMVDAYDSFFNTAIQLGIIGEKAPIFQTTAGGIAYTDNATGCYSIDFADGQLQNITHTNAPAGEFYQGDYITLYYLGMGIMLEYYN